MLKRISAYIFASLVLFCAASCSDSGSGPSPDVDSESEDIVYKVENCWGGSGDGDGQFNDPGAMTADSEGNIYIVDTGNNRIQKFDPDRNFILKWGTSGEKAGEFNNPMGIAIYNDELIYIADTKNHRIQKFDAVGNCFGSIGEHGTGEGEFDEPVGLALDSDGNIYVADSGNNRIQKFDPKGSFLISWGSYGGEQGQLDNPTGIVIDKSNFIYVVDSGNHRIQKFTCNGSFILEWGQYGSDEGSFISPNIIDIDDYDNIYVGDFYNNRIQKFNTDGSLIHIFDLSAILEQLPSGRLMSEPAYNSIESKDSYLNIPYFGDMPGGGQLSRSEESPGNFLYSRDSESPYDDESKPPYPYIGIFNFTTSGYNYSIQFGKTDELRNMFLDMIGYGSQNNISYSEFLKDLRRSFRQCYKTGCLSGKTRKDCEDSLKSSIRGLSSYHLEHYYRYYMRIKGACNLMPRCEEVAWINHASMELNVEKGGTYDFGNIYLDGLDAKAVKFIIKNKYEALKDLLLTGNPVISVSGPDAASFSYIIGDQRRIETEKYISFFVVFEPGDSEAKTATISIQSNDPDTPVYSFTVTGISKPLPPDQYESLNDDDFTTENSMSPDTSPQIHSISVWGDEDFIKIQAEKGVAYNIETQSNTTDTIDINTFIHLYDSDQNLVTCNDSWGYGNYSRIRWECQETGTYFIKVSKSGFRGAGNYLLLFDTITAKPDPYETDNDLSTRNELIPGLDPQEHSFHEENDIDYIMLNALEDVTYDIFLRYGSTNTRPEISLYSGSNDLIKTGTEQSSTSALLSWKCTGTGTYYIQIREKDGHKGSYLISADSFNDSLFSDLFEPDNDFSEAKPIDVNGSPQPHTFHDSFDLDVHRFNAHSGQTYILSTGFRSVLTPTEITLYDPSLNPVSSDMNSGEHGYSKLVWDCTRTGEFYVATGTTGPNYGDYYISVKEARSISGKITDTGVGVENITLRLLQNGSEITTVKTDAGGFYRFKGLSEGSYLVVPESTDHRFSPGSRQCTLANNITDADFTSDKKIWKHPGSMYDYFNPSVYFTSNHLAEDIRNLNVLMNENGQTLIVWEQTVKDITGLHKLYKSEFRDGEWIYPESAQDCLCFPEPYYHFISGETKAVLNENGDALISWLHEKDNQNNYCLYLTHLKNGLWHHPGFDDNINIGRVMLNDRGSLLLDDDNNAVVLWREMVPSPTVNWEYTGPWMSEYRYNSWVHRQSVMTWDTSKRKQILASSTAKNGDMVILFQVCSEDEFIIDEYGREREAWNLYIAEYREGRWILPEKENRINPVLGTSCEFTSAEVVMNDNGSSVILWKQLPDPSKNDDRQLYISTYKNGKWKHPASVEDCLTRNLYKIGTGFSGIGGKPRGSIDNNDDIVVVFLWATGESYSIGQTNYGISKVYMAECRNSTWQIPSYETGQISLGNESCLAPIVKHNKKGDCIIVWGQNKGRKADNSLYSFYVSIYRDGVWHHPESLEDTINEINFDLYKETGIHDDSVFIDESCNIIMTWMRFMYDGEGYSICRPYMKEYRNGQWGEAVWMGSNIINDNTSIIGFKVAANNRGDAVIVWAQETLDEDNQRRIQLFKSERR